MYRRPWLYIFLLCILASLQASQVDLVEFKQRFNKPLGIVIGLVCQFIFLPAAGFASIRIFFPDKPVYGIPLLVTVCSPGGSYSNWWCSLFNSDLPLSMAMTTASSLFAVATLPINILIYLRLAYPNRDGSVALDWGGLFTSLGIVVAGIFGGLIVGNRDPSRRATLGKLGNASGVCLVLLGFFFSSNSSAPIWARDDDFYIGVSVPCLFGLVISLGFAYVCGLPRPQCLSVTIETCYQNTAIPLAVILSSFSNDDVALCKSVGVNPEGAGEGKGGGEDGVSVTCDVIGIAAGVPTFYQMVQILALGFVCVYGWKAGWTYAPPEHSMWKVLMRNYQPGIADEIEQENRRLARGRASFGGGVGTPLPTLEEDGIALDDISTGGGSPSQAANRMGDESPGTPPQDAEGKRACAMEDGSVPLTSGLMLPPSTRSPAGDSPRGGNQAGKSNDKPEASCDSRVSIGSIDLEANVPLNSYPLPPTPLKKINQPPREDGSPSKR